MKSRIINTKRIHNNSIYQVLLEHYGNDKVEEVIKHIKTYFECKDYKVIDCVYDFSFGGRYICTMK